jgi:hypothetical protein
MKLLLITMISLLCTSTVKVKTAKHKKTVVRSTYIQSPFEIANKYMF